MNNSRSWYRFQSFPRKKAPGQTKAPFKKCAKLQKVDA